MTLSALFTNLAFRATQTKVTDDFDLTFGAHTARTR